MKKIINLVIDLDNLKEYSLEELVIFLEKGKNLLTKNEQEKILRRIEIIS